MSMHGVTVCVVLVLQRFVSAVSVRLQPGSRHQPLCCRSVRRQHRPGCCTPGRRFHAGLQRHSQSPWGRVGEETLSLVPCRVSVQRCESQV